MAWMTVHNKGRVSYMVRRRKLVTHPRGTISRVREVTKYTPWESTWPYTTLEKAKAAIAAAKGDGYEYAVFYGGRRVWSN